MGTDDSDGPSPVHVEWRPSRRQILGAGAAAGAILLGLELIDRGVSKLFLPARRRGNVVPVQTLWLRRADDLLAIRFDFYNFQIDATDPTTPKLVPTDPTQPSLVVANFPSQHVAEQAFLETSMAPPGPGEALTPPPVQSVMAGESRLAFKLQPGVTSVPLSNQLLAWAGLRPNVNPLAAAPAPEPDGGSGHQPPRPAANRQAPAVTETAIEIPWRLILSTHDQSQWVNAVSAVTHNNRTELWHTRLVVRPELGPPGLLGQTPLDQPRPNLQTVRAIWNLDPDLGPNLQSGTVPSPDPANSPFPFRTSLDHADRFNIVANSSVDKDITTSTGATTTIHPRPILVRRLMLSSLGGWIEAEGLWDADQTHRPFNNPMVEWRQRGTQGRDHYVKVVNQGYAYPYGHPAVLIKVTERKFQFADGTTSPPVAYLRQRFYVAIRRPAKAYTAPGQPNEGRSMPFRQLTFKTVVSPVLDAFTQPANVPGVTAGANVFVPQVNGADFMWHVIGTDWAGIESEFTTPIIFVDLGAAFGSIATALNAHYQSADPRFQIPFSGKRLHIAESATPDDTAVEAQSISMGADSTIPASTLAVGALQALDQPPFYPALVNTQVRIKAAERLKGQSLTSGGVLPTLKLSPEYVAGGFGGSANQGQVFAELDSSVTPQAVALNFGGQSKDADKVGGMATVNFNIQGLSRSLGPVGDLAGIKSGQFNPQAFLDTVSAQFLGGINLSDIIGQLPGLDPDGAETDLGAHLKLKNTLILADDPLAPPVADVTTLTWTPPLSAGPGSLAIFDPKTPDNTAAISVTATVDLVNPSNSDFQVNAIFSNFDINLFGKGDFSVITLTFSQLRFSVQKGKKPSFDVNVSGVAFNGVFHFVDQLKDLLKSLGNGPSLDISTTGLTVGWHQSIPSVAVGAFTLANMSLNMSFNLPFTGKPARVRFSFCTRENPFLLTVTFFGGGGFFAVGLGTDGLELVEASLEFGAACSINLGVASGGVHIMAGIYFKLEQVDSTHQNTTLTGYLRMGGELTVLGVVTITVEFYMGFTYESSTNKVTGQATLTVSVKVLFFSASVSLHVERKFGGQGDPNFLAAVPDQSTWTQYCAAFAPVGS